MSISLSQPSAIAVDNTEPLLDSLIAKQPVNMATDLDRTANHDLELLKSGNFADAEIVCNETKWKVHKLILRSRCPWFEKAFKNDWQEAQTGLIRLDEEKPERINDLLKFIYSGRYVTSSEPMVHCVSAPVLDRHVSLWRTADFFLLPDLKAEIQGYLLAKFASTLRYFHEHGLPLTFGSSGFYVGTMYVREKDKLDIFFADFSEAVAKVYTSPAARYLQKLFAVFACGLREELPEDIMWGLLDGIPEFQSDVSTVLIALHFPKATSHSVRNDLLDFGVSTAREGYSAWPGEDCLCYRCSECGKESPKPVLRGPYKRIYWYMTLDPFSSGTRKWCTDCAFQSMQSLLKNVISEWPVGAANSG